MRMSASCCLILMEMTGEGGLWKRSPFFWEGGAESWRLAHMH